MFKACIYLLGLGAMTRFSQMGMAMCLAFILCGLMGCVTHRKNPAFNLSLKNGQKHLKEMAQKPRHLQRPLIILRGFSDFGWLSYDIRKDLSPALRGKPVITVSFMTAFTMDGCRKRVFKTLERALPGWSGQGLTPEVDVIGLSLGGIVARHAATKNAKRWGDNHPQLNIHHLYTIASPHQGAALSKNIATYMGPLKYLIPCDFQKHLHPKSEFIRQLAETNKGQVNYSMTAYVRLSDGIIGEFRAAPQGQGVYWVPGQTFGEPAHLLSLRDPRILADIARQLRQEPRLSRAFPSPLPEGIEKDEMVHSRLASRKER